MMIWRGELLPLPLLVWVQLLGALSLWLFQA
jgi:hypothetical protein